MSAADPVPAPAPVPRLDSWRRRETSIALLNLGVIAALFLLHVGFITLLGPPRPVLVWVLAALFLFQTLTLVWVQGRQRLPSLRTACIYGTMSVWLTVLGAILAAVFGEGDEHHYFVLMVPAIVGAAFRFSLVSTLAVVAVAVGFTLFDVWQWFERHPPHETHEYFEASTIGIVFAVVGALTWLFAAAQRRDEHRLRTSLDELEHTRDRLVAEEKLSAIGRLSSSIAHEIRNPVAMISSSLAAARREGLDETQRAAMFDVATAEAARLERVTSDFLLYARTAPPERRPTALAETIGYVTELVRARAHEVHVNVTPEAAPGLTADIDPHQIHHALLNLLANALDHTPAGGRVRIGAARGDGGGVVLWVENAGPAIAAVVVERLYEPFFTTRRGGTGLGMPIARNIAHAHGGELMLADNRDGCVRFEIVLPAVVTHTGGEAGGADEEGPVPFVDRDAEPGGAAGGRHA